MWLGQHIEFTTFLNCFFAEFSPPAPGNRCAEKRMVVNRNLTTPR
jgi:hypothetical protein